MGTLLGSSSLRRRGKPQADALCLELGSGWGYWTGRQFLGHLPIPEGQPWGRGSCIGGALGYILMLQVQGIFLTLRFNQER